MLTHAEGVQEPFGQRYPAYVLVELADSADEAALNALLESVIGQALEDELCLDAVVSASLAQLGAVEAARNLRGAARRWPAPEARRVPAHRAHPGLHGLGPGPAAGAVLRHPPLHLRPLRRRQPALQPVAPGRRARDWAAQGAAITDAVLDEVNRYGGSISAEHGIGQLKRDHFLHSKDPLELRLMREIKRLVDPAGIMNPGKLL